MLRGHAAYVWTCVIVAVSQKNSCKHAKWPLSATLKSTFVLSPSSLPALQQAGVSRGRSNRSKSRSNSEQATAEEEQVSTEHYHHCHRT
jgi:hypothetical protein